MKQQAVSHHQHYPVSHIYDPQGYRWCSGGTASISFLLPEGSLQLPPSSPKYSMTWDVDIVFSHIRGMEDNEVLSFQLLSHKLSMLLALTNADRCSDLAALDLTYRSFQGNGVKFIIPGLTKTRRVAHQGRPSIWHLHQFQSYVQFRHFSVTRRGQRSCVPVVTVLHKKHFLSLSENPTDRSTIGHWLKGIMKPAGIDTDIFTAHSTRAASTSKAKAVGVPTADTLKAANWSSTSTFCHYYHKLIDSPRFGCGVLEEK